LNQRPLGPQPSALPDCATPRSTHSRPRSVRGACEHAFAMRDGAAHQVCYSCGGVKRAEEFAWRRKARNQRDSFCRGCRRAYKRGHYLANRARYIDRARAQKRRLADERTRYLLEFFVAHPCVDCGERDPVVLEFDHLRDKEFDIGRELSRRSWHSILEEMAKCDVVCANCHRRRTARRRGSLRAVMTREFQPIHEAGDEN
jgi:hypothetical protein